MNLRYTIKSFFVAPTTGLNSTAKISLRSLLVLGIAQAEFISLPKSIVRQHLWYDLKLPQILLSVSHQRRTGAKPSGIHEDIKKDS